MPVRSSETRRIHSLLGQRRVSDVVMVIILSVALLAGLVGFAVHVLWIVAVVALRSATWSPTPVRIAERPSIVIGRRRNGPRDPPGAHSRRVLIFSPLTIDP